MSDLQRPNLSGWFAHKTDPDTGHKTQITRQQTCECGREFTQHLLSGRFCEIVERHSEKAIEKLMQEVPDLFVPVLCPPCESKALNTSRPEIGSWMIPVRKRMEDRARFARNMAQLCAAYNKPMDDETSQVFWRALERALTDEEFERGVINAVRIERKWPTPSIIAQHAKVA